MGIGVSAVRIAWLAGKIAFSIWLSSWLIAPPTSTGQELKLQKPKKEKPEKPPKLDKSDRPQISKEDKIIFATAQRTFGAETDAIAG